MSHVINQHIVPKLLLKYFSNKNQTHIWSFDKKAVGQLWENEKYRAIKNTPTEKYIYDYVAGCDINSIEYQLKKIETKIDPLISKLVISKNINKLSTAEKSLLSEFIAYQILRTKESYNNTIRIFNDFYKPIEKYLNKKIEINSKQLWLDILKNSSEYKNNLMNKTWILAESNEQFYTSDNPVVFQNSTNYRKERGNLGLNSKGVEIYFPLSSSIVLCMFCSKTISNISSNLVCDKEIIESLNYLQFKHSGRFIFSKKGDFNFINELIKKNAM